MASRRIDAEIDRLYQLPPDAFTAARNALAKTAGPGAAEIRGLVKPPIAAWAVNQIYWKRRDVYDALIEAATALRKTHKAILGGRRSDVREGAKAHDEAIDAALKAALALLREEGHPATDVTRQAVVTTLRALPGNDPPGRLTRTLQPGGFEMLAGLSIAGVPKPVVVRKPEPPVSPTGKTSRLKAKATRAEATAAAVGKAEREAAVNALRDAEQAARQQEFEVARLSRDADKAASRLDDARGALEAAQQSLDAAEAAAVKAARERDGAVARAKGAERVLEVALRRLDDLRS